MLVFLVPGRTISVFAGWCGFGKVRRFAYCLVNIKRDIGVPNVLVHFFTNCVCSVEDF